MCDEIVFAEILPLFEQSHFSILFDLSFSDHKVPGKEWDLKMK
jgi:hypothetical protein